MNPLLIVSIDGLRAEDVLDEGIRLPNIRRVIAHGASVKRLKTIFPSVTWPIHTSVVTGCQPAKTGILGNSVFDRVKGKRMSLFDPACARFDQDQACDNLFDSLGARSAQVAAICWPLTQGAQSIRFNIPELYSQAHFESFASPVFWAELKAAGFPVHNYGAWSADHRQNPLQDKLSCDIAAHLIQSRSSDAIFLHFLLIDSFQHDFGVGSAEAVWAMEYVDGLIGRVLAELDGQDRFDETNVILFSDHGHASTAQAFHVDRWLQEAGMGGGVDHQGPFVAVSNGGLGYLYRIGGDQASEAALSQELSALPFVRAVWSRSEFAILGLPTEESGDKGHLPDLIFELVPDHMVLTGEGSGIVVGECGLKSMHGYHPDLASMDSFLACTGPGFARGVRLESASILDIAPLVNRIYDLGLTDMDGELRLEMLGMHDR